MADGVRAHDRFGGNGWWSPKNLDDPDEDRRLFLEAALGGSREALGDLVNSLWRDVCLYFARRLAKARNIAAKVSADDLTQDACDLVLANFERFAGHTLGEYRKWLFTIARNLWAAILRHYAPGTDHDVLRERAFEEAAVACHGYGRRGPTAEEVFAALEERDLLAAAMDALPRDQRQVVTLWRDEQKSLAAISRELHWSPDAVEKTFQRALQALRRLLRREATAA